MFTSWLTFGDSGRLLRLAARCRPSLAHALTQRVGIGDDFSFPLTMDYNKTISPQPVQKTIQKTAQMFKIAMQPASDVTETIFAEEKCCWLLNLFQIREIRTRMNENDKNWAQRVAT